MIRFLIKGLLRDKSRSRVPVLVVAIGVMLTVFMHAYIKGFMGETIEMNARFNAGHLKVMTRAYAENMEQIPNDLALLQAGDLMKKLKEDHPDMEWASRIQFGGLVDVPDEKGETRSQGPVIGIGLDLLSQGTREKERLNLGKSLVRGALPSERGEILLSETFAGTLNIEPGDTVTFIGSTMEGSLAMLNFVMAGTLSFGVEVLDKGSMVADLKDVQQVLMMEDAAGEIIGFLKDGFYDDDVAIEKATAFNELYENNTDEFSPVMKTLGQQGTLGTYVSMSNVWGIYISMVFILAMSLVLWNAGLLGGLRRYGEFGIRLAMGETKSHVYSTLIYESVFIGIAGTILGTFLGLTIAWLIQKYGISLGSMMKGSAVMFPSSIRARITFTDYYLGFFPGLFSTVIGTMLSGVGIYKRQTARLFKELEA